MRSSHASGLRESFQILFNSLADSSDKRLECKEGTSSVIDCTKDVTDDLIPISWAQSLFPLFFYNLP